MAEFQALYFSLLFLFAFLPGVLNDFRLVKAVPWDGIAIAAALCWLVHDCGPLFWSAPALSMLCALGGLTLASLERFCVGFVFHAGKRVELWHEDFHEQVCVCESVYAGEGVGWCEGGRSPPACVDVAPLGYQT
jgi:hypothetical protein